MVNEVCANVSFAVYGSSPSRSQESKKAGFHNMHEQIRKKSLQQAPKSNFGPMFRDRDHFASLHHC